MTRTARRRLTATATLSAALLLAASGCGTWGRSAAPAHPRWSGSLTPSVRATPPAASMAPPSPACPVNGGTAAVTQACTVSLGSGQSIRVAVEPQTQGSSWGFGEVFGTTAAVSDARRSPDGSLTFTVKAVHPGNAWISVGEPMGDAVATIWITVSVSA